jgi:predicted double-glycine peptidase
VAVAALAFTVPPPATTVFPVVESRREVRLVTVSSTPAPLATTTVVDQVPAEPEAVLQPALTVDTTTRIPIATPATVATQTTESSSKRVVKGVIPDVPFYSQFTDISSAAWQKVGCGIASLAMLIDYYSDETVSVDQLLERGIAARAYLDNAGWIHSGLIDLSQAYGLDGESRSLAGLGGDEAFTKLTEVLADGPVMASVHYTFEPTNPIPHLVVVTGVEDGKVFYNDPAEPAGNGSLSIEKFKRAWKQRYIVIRPVSGV